YDALVEMFGGKPMPACGFAIGVERLLELMRASGEQFVPNEGDVYIVHQGETAQLQASVLAERLRDAGLDVVLHCAAANASTSFKSQMKRADASGAAYAIIIGDNEIAASTVAVKALRTGTQGEQIAVPFDAVIDYLVDQIIGDDTHEHSAHEHGHLHP
ncbi:MAG: His/Gly/Thr/Pro-type tRNA ligase C-terminal domain-containing protein, partial [Herbaspirillum sp.]